MSSNDSFDETDKILARSLEIAKHYSLKYVSTKILFYVVIEAAEVKVFLETYGTNVTALLDGLHQYFSTDAELERVSTDAPDHVRPSSLKRVFEHANAQRLAFSREKLGTADLLFALLQDATLGADFRNYITQAGGKVDEILEQLQKYLQNSSKADNIAITPQTSTEAAKSVVTPKTAKKDDDKPNPDDALKEFCVNLNEKALNGEIDPVIGREREVSKIVQTLGRKNKQNVILVGASGIGKTAIADGLVMKIIEGDVPEEFKKAVVYSLDMGTLVAGTRFRGDFEERLKNIINAIKKDKNNILFIDEIHMIRGAGSSSEAAMDAANILKPALASRDIRVIGATTYDEFQKHFEKDKALMRRFLRLDVFEPSVSETKEILRGAAKYFEKFHGILYDVDALDLAVDLTGKYIHDRQFPDKALDIIDSVGAKIKLYNRDQKVVTVADIEREVSIIAKIPDISIKVDESAKLRELETRLKGRIFGQDHVVEDLVNHVLVAKSGLRDPEKPLLSALFRGQTGCGKTELAKQLASELGIEFVRFDMSEYQEKHSVSKFIGAPPGFVGFGEGQAGAGLLVSAIENTPHCVLLLDEVEKAAPEVLTIFLQIMDYGMLTSSTGKTVSFRNAIIIMSSNLGAKDKEKHTIGFGVRSDYNDADKTATNDFFAPEFRNRLDMAITFNKLNKDVLSLIINKFVKETNALLKDKDVIITLSEKVKDRFVAEVVSLNLGARPLNSMIAKEIKQPLSKMILFGDIKAGTKLLVDEEDGKIVFNPIIENDLVVV